jgi:hypothetical protein
MNLDLTDKERDKLVMVLENYIPELRGEIASGVKHDWKIALKEEKVTLGEVLKRLKELR